MGSGRNYEHASRARRTARDVVDTRGYGERPRDPHEQKENVRQRRLRIREARKFSEKASVLTPDGRGKVVSVNLTSGSVDVKVGRSPRSRAYDPFVLQLI